MFGTLWGSKLKKMLILTIYGNLPRGGMEQKISKKGNSKNVLWIMEIQNIYWFMTLGGNDAPVELVQVDH